MGSRSCLLGFALACALAGSTSAHAESVIYSFPYQSNAYGRLYQDSKGTIFGTTYGQQGGPYGSVFSLRKDHGAWKETTLHEFKGIDGANSGSGVVMDKNGVLYGETDFGGTYGHGTVFALAKTGRTWNETVLHSFDVSDGSAPNGRLLYDRKRNALYGVAVAGGNSSYCGTVFELTQSGGTWAFATIYEFQGAPDGCAPQTALHLGSSDRALFSVTIDGGAHKSGSFFELQRRGGSWAENVIYSFRNDRSGGYPVDVARGDQSGDLFYGITSTGGRYGDGVVFKLQKAKSGWHESVLYSLDGSTDGTHPNGLKRDATTGSLYGTTYSGGPFDGGALIRLVPTRRSWSESVVYNFRYTGEDGGLPISRPIRDKSTGTLLGTTQIGGANNGGVVWMASP